MSQFNPTSSNRPISFFNEDGGLTFLPPGVLTSSIFVTGSATNDLANQTGSLIIEFSTASSAVQFRIPSESSKQTEDIIALHITSSGKNPRVGIGTTNPLTVFDFKDIEEGTQGTEILLRSSRTGSGAQIGDSAGKFNFTIDSASFTDIRTTGSIAAIETKVDEVSSTGVTGEFIIGLANAKSRGPIDRFKINNTKTEITGALDVSTDVSGSDLHFSSSGQSFINRLAVGTSLQLTPGSFNRFIVGGNAIFTGDVTMGNQASDLINIEGITTITGDITASGDISASGYVIGNRGQFSNQVEVNGEVALSTTDSATTGKVFADSQITKIKIGKAGSITSTLLESNVTASGDISASGTITGNSLVGTVGTATQGTIDHDSLANFVANEHIDHSGVSITAGAGLTGGGTIASTRDIAVGAGTGVTVNADDIAIGQDVATTANVQFANITGSSISASGDLFVRSRTITYSTTAGDYSGDVVSFGNGPSGNDGNINAGELYYLDSSQNWEQADADASSTATNMLGIAVADNTATFLVKGIIKNTAYGGFTTGLPLYVSTTAGDMTITAPSGTGDIVRVVGYGINGGSRIIYFNPSNDFIVHA